MKNIIIISILSIFIGLSCTDLDEKLYDKIPGDKFPENDLQISLLGIDGYSKLRDLIDDGGWWFLAQEISSDEFCGPTRAADWDDGGKWRVMHRHTWTNDVEGVNRMWSAMWSGVTVCNQALDLIHQIAASESTNKKIAEIEVLRSFYYYLLIDNYGDVPYLTSATNVTQEPFKVKRAAIFDSLTNNIKRAIPKLALDNNKYLVTRYTAFALLAKLYLNAEVYTGTADWAQAEQYTDSILNGPYALESDFLAPFKTNNENSSEIIFSIAFDQDFAKGFRLHMRTLHYQMNLKYDMPVGPWNGLCITPNFFDTYAENDKRKQGYNIYGPQYDSQGKPIIDGETHEALVIDPHLPALVMQAGEFTVNQYRNSGARVQKYEIAMGAKENLSNDFPIFRLSDFYLMKAEEEIRQNGPGSGDQYITPIRTRAGISAASGFGLDSLLAERGRELYCEGHRRQDLIRFGEFTKPWWEKGLNGAEGKFGDPSVNTFPIPKWATDANPNLLVDPE